jgi:hypothetical protein
LEVSGLVMRKMYVRIGKRVAVKALKGGARGKE